ncbi:phosphoinositide-interacting protein-like [Megalobrama amblycephala]|uniref:phosphoinositide-interacting protein-like n=1 Tax=Megalobrama amblycephala TaxID=75352 RepID=UPI002013E1A6|nr:phosphoinositide-interacting protein-like [Megalobrama amblycephala]
MTSVPEHLPLGDCSRSYSCEQLTPRSENTIFSLSHKEIRWNPQPPPGNCEYYWQAILLMTAGGSVLLCGMVLSGLYFAGVSTKATNILGPALLSIGLMVLVVGVVLMPITQEMRHQSATKRLCSYYKPQINL